MRVAAGAIRPWSARRYPTPQAAPNLVDCVVLPRDRQATTNYLQLLDVVATGEFDNMEMSGIALVGEKKLVRRMTAGLGLWG